MHNIQLFQITKLYSKKKRSQNVSILYIYIYTYIYVHTIVITSKYIFRPLKGDLQFVRPKEIFENVEYIFTFNILELPTIFVIYKLEIAC
jgi:hypothetical protein